jgi:hypothetical protein
MASLYTALVDLTFDTNERGDALFSANSSDPIDLAGHYNQLSASLKREQFEHDTYDARSDKEIYRRIGGMFAAAIHLECNAAYDARNGNAEAAASSADVTAKTDRLVKLMRVAAARGDKEFTHYVLFRIVSTHLQALREALGGLGEASTSDEQIAHASLCHDARRSAMLAAAALYLYQRQCDPRLAASTQALAARREGLVSERIDTADAVTSFAGLEPSSRVVFAGAVSDGLYVDRPSKPYTRLVTGENEELRVHFKNTRWLGIAENQFVVVRCKAEEPADGVSYAVAEFEGPTTSSGSIWESWLQQQVREHYDLAPESIHWWASFPSLSSTLAPLHYLAHINGRG